jgi:hypothetical protein
VLPGNGMLSAWLEPQFCPAALMRFQVEWTRAAIDMMTLAG